MVKTRELGKAEHKAHDEAAVQVAAAEGAGLVVGVVSFFYFLCGQLH